MAALKMKADWKELPTELLHLISQRIDTEIDLIRFRSVCSHWRSSSIPNHHLNILPFEVPLLKLPLQIESNNEAIPISFCHLSKTSFFLIKPTQEQERQTRINLRPWLIKTTQTSNGVPKLSQFQLLSFDFPFHVLDFNKLSVFHLGCQFLVEEDSKPSSSDFVLPEAVVVLTCNGKKPIALTKKKYSPPFMLLLRSSSDEKLFLFQEDFSNYVDYICVFKQRIYAAVDGTGKTITMGPEENPNVELVAEPLVDHGNMRFLVESEGDLLLVDISDHDLTVDVFRLDEKERKWVEIENLGDRVLFIGLQYSFSASASDLCVSEGNCIIFIDDVFFYDHTDTEHIMAIFFMGQDGQLWPLSDYPEYYNLFWPPPEWIVKSHSH